ncbi:prenyltransferase, UbiA family [Peptostreptococcaceae bacterium AS15]|nr:prenyltransferase, UbiA family [Peptostreptococcaceae bacterium AS15]
MKNNHLTAKLALQLAAPHTWIASIGPVLFGILFCKLENYPLSFWKSILLVLTCIFMQSSVNTLNDYVDFIKGNDKKEDNVEESDAVLIYNSINPKDVLLLGIIYLILGAVLGIIACKDSGFLPLGIGCIGGMVILLYSGGPLPISYLPIGEIVSGFVMGILIPLGVAAVSDGKFHSEILLYAFPLMMGISLIMMTNNGCDIEKDTHANRQTLAVILGRKNIKNLYHILVVLWLLIVSGLSVYLLGMVGCITPALIVLGYKCFKLLMQSELLASKRIEQMKNIVKANIIVNIAYFIAILTKIIAEMV